MNMKIFIKSYLCGTYLLRMAKMNEMIKNMNKIWLTFQIEDAVLQIRRS